MEEADRLYARFCARLEPPAHELAIELPYALKLAPSRTIPWSAVFQYPVTLLAPRLFAQTVPIFEAIVVEHASLAHLLGVISAFATDRLEDGQVTSTAVLRSVINALRTARREAMFELCGLTGLEIDIAAEETTAAAIRNERRYFELCDGVAWQEYLELSSKKQALGLVGTRALALGSNRAQLSTMFQEALLAIALALQLRDDVVDWEEDAAHGRAWALLLATYKIGSRIPPETPFSAQRERVHATGILSEMLRASAEGFERASRILAQFPPSPLARFLSHRASKAYEDYENENRHPGYIVRRAKLSAWAEHVAGVH